MFIYGTAWKEDRTEALVALALANGFRALDTANQRRHYFEAAVGAAVAASGLARDALFLQTKFTHRAGQDHRLPYDEHAPIGEQVEQSFASSLEHLRTTYIDSYVLHGPSLRGRLADEDVAAWRAMEKLHDRGVARQLGISNVDRAQLEQLLGLARVRPAVVQNRCYARTRWDHAIRAMCRDHGISYQGFSLLTANRAELARPAVDGVMQRSGLTRAQVVFRFAQQVGMTPLTGTSSAEHMREDLRQDGVLSAADVALLEDIAAS